MHCTMTRAGIILYGYRPDASVPPVLDLRPAMTVKARVVQVRDIPAHTTISYGRTFETASRRVWRSFRSDTQTAFCVPARARRTVLLGGVQRPSRPHLHGYVHGAHSRRARRCTAATRSRCSARARGRRRMPPRPPVPSRTRCCARSAAACRVLHRFKMLHKMKRGAISNCSLAFSAYPVIIFVTAGDNRFAEPDQGTRNLFIGV